MFGKKKEGKFKGVTEVDKVLYNVIGEVWNQLPQASDHWVKYLAAVRPHADNADAFDVRIFDDWCAKEKHLKVVDYTSLDASQDLIVLEGWYDRKQKKGDIKLRKAA